MKTIRVKPLQFFALSVALCLHAGAQDAVTRVVPLAPEPAASARPAPAPTGAPEASPSATPAMAAPSPDASPSPNAAPSPAPSPVAAPSPSPVTSATTELTGTGAVAPTATPRPPSIYAIEIDLTHQRAVLLAHGEVVAESPVSSGRPGHLTPVGNFEVIQKDLNHVSNLYGKFVEKGSGRVVKSGADSAMPVPKGCKFVPAPMKWFMRFDGAAGMHAGVLPGYAASHGCVRMPASKAELFYSKVDIGTPVHVFGQPPEHVSHASHHEATAKATPAPAPTPAPKKRHFLFF